MFEKVKEKQLSLASVYCSSYEFHLLSKPDIFYNNSPICQLMIFSLLNKKKLQEINKANILWAHIELSIINECTFLPLFYCNLSV